MSDTDTRAALTRGQVLTRGEVLLHPDTPNSTWLALTSNDDLTVISTTDIEPTEEQLDDEALLRRLVTAQQVSAERFQLAEDRLQELREKVLEIRGYAIDRHREGAFCRQGLNDALQHFGLDPYEPRYAVEVVVCATVELNADSESEAADRVRYLVDGLDYSGDSSTDQIEVRMTDLDVREINPV